MVEHLLYARIHGGSGQQHGARPLVELSTERPEKLGEGRSSEGEGMGDKGAVEEFSGVQDARLGKAALEDSAALGWAVPCAEAAMRTVR